MWVEYSGLGHRLQRSQGSSGRGAHAAGKGTVEGFRAGSNTPDGSVPGQRGSSVQESPIWTVGSWTLSWLPEGAPPVRHRSPHL